jgi:ABC-type uncharacterized transport system YnjBCD ATPase subunit
MERRRGMASVEPGWEQMERLWGLIQLKLTSSIALTKIFRMICKKSGLTISGNIARLEAAHLKLIAGWLADQAMNRTAVKYDDQKDFADMWWRRHYLEYKHMGFVFQDQFLNDAIVDATNVWTYFVFLDNPGALSVTWKDELVYRAIAKK